MSTTLTPAERMLLNDWPARFELAAVVESILASRLAEAEERAGRGIDATYRIAESVGATKVRNRVEEWINDPVRRIWLDPDDAASLRDAMIGKDNE